MAVLGVVDTKNDDPQWEAVTKSFNEFFGTRLKGFVPLPVNRAKEIKRFAFRNLDSGRPELGALLALYVLHQMELRPTLKDERPILEEAFSVDGTLTRVQTFLRTKNPNTLSPRTQGYDVAGLLRTLHGVFGTSDHKTIEGRLFGGDTRARPVSTYAIYRYSTGWAGVVKSFLTILSPRVNSFGSFTFTHVYGPGDSFSAHLSWCSNGAWKAQSPSLRAAG